KRKAQSKDWAFCFICCLSVSDYSESRTKSSGTILHSTECCPEGDGQEARHTTARHQTVKKPILTDGLFCVCVHHGKCRMAASPYPAYMNPYQSTFRRETFSPLTCKLDIGVISGYLQLSGCLNV
ncbi:hypothetical protein PU088_004483, partial [Citrobacter farmeri]